MKQARGKVILSLSSEQGKGKEWGWGLGAKTAPGLGCEQGQPLGRACFLQSRSGSGETHTETAWRRAFSPVVFGVRGEFMVPAQT